MFLPEQGDHYRTRLTHTIEVAQIARTLTRALGLNDDLAEALALAHDLGHAPFGHTGEDALGEAMRPFGGFDHNVQTIRIVMRLERRYPRFRGLNLTWDTLEGLIKRSRSDALLASDPGWHGADLACFADPTWSDSFRSTERPSAEAQAAALADDIAYNAHDLEDGLQAGLFSPTDLDQVPALATVRDRLLRDDPELAPELLMRGLAREIVGLFVEDAVEESHRRLAVLAPTSVAQIRDAGDDVVAVSEPLAAASRAIKQFLFVRMYRHPQLVSLRGNAHRIVSDLAGALLADRALLPPDWRDVDPCLADPRRHARVVADYIAGMTDRYAVAEHRRLFDDTPDLR